MIKFALRRNLRYPLQLLIWNTIRDIEKFLIKIFFDFNNSEIFCLLMFLGELIAGLIFYLYNQKILAKDKKGKSLFFNLGNIKAKEGTVKDSKIKIMFLLFYASFLDLIQFTLFLHYSSFVTISNSLEQRFRGIFTIFLAFYYYYLLKFHIYKHQIFSLIIIGVCILIIVITEFIFQDIDIFLSYLQFFIALILIFVILFISSLGQTIEKYLIEVDELSPFYINTIEGTFGTILSLVYIIFYNSLDYISQKTKNLSILEFVFLILLFILYIILSGGKNLFRLVTMKIFSPMTSAFMNYILNPFYIIFYFISGNDFLSNGKSNYAYFIVNLIVSLVITFCSFVYNDFLILFCCGFERDTYNQVSFRSISEVELDTLYNEEEEEQEENEKADEKENDGLF